MFRRRARDIREAVKEVVKEYIHTLLVDFGCLSITALY